MSRFVVPYLLVGFLVLFWAEKPSVTASSFGIFEFGKKNVDPADLKESMVKALDNLAGNIRKGALEIQKQLKLSKREVTGGVEPDVPQDLDNPSTNDAPANPFPAMPPMKPFINPNETEAERAERIHRTFEKMLMFVEIVGQVDSYVSNKWKNFVKTVSHLYNSDEDSDLVALRRRRKTCRGCD